MLNNLLALSKMQNGLFTLILGMLVIFFGIAVIVFFVTLVGRAINKPVKEEKVNEPAPVSVEPVQEVAQPVSDDEIPEEIRVAIIAAISAYYDNNQPKHEFTVRKIKKIRN